MGFRLTALLGLLLLGLRGPHSGSQVLPGESLARLAGQATRSDAQFLVLFPRTSSACVSRSTPGDAEQADRDLSAAIDLLEREPSIRLDLQEVLSLRRFLARRPERGTTILQLAKAGRLRVGASLTRPAEDFSSSESLARQFYAGRLWFRRNFPGCDTRSYWNPDVPGRTLQMPQVLLRAGVHYLVMGRFARGLFRWKSPDGLDILAFSPGRVHGSADQGDGGMPDPSVVAVEALEWKDAVPSASSRIPILHETGSEGLDLVVDLVQRWNRTSAAKPAPGSAAQAGLPPIRFSGLEEYLNLVAPFSRGLPTIRGERPNLWLYAHGPSNARAVSAKREADFLLPAAEAFSAIDAILRRDLRLYPGRELNAAWEAQLVAEHECFNSTGEQDGRPAASLFQKVRDISEEMVGRAQSSIAGRIRVRPGRGRAAVVFNSLSWPRSGPVECTVESGGSAGSGEILVEDALGRPVPSQTKSLNRDAEGRIRSAVVLFAARGVPAFGYSTFYLRSTDAPPTPRDDSRAVDEIDTEQYHVTLEPGGVRQVFDKRLGRGLLAEGGRLGGEVLETASEGYCAGEWTVPPVVRPAAQDPPRAHGASWRLIESGPVRVVVESGRTLDHATLRQRVVVYRSSSRIDFETTLLGWDGTPDREFRMAFPLALSRPRVSYEVPFGAVEWGKDEMKGAPGGGYDRDAASIRQRSVQRWIGASDQTCGIVFSAGVPVWELADTRDAASGVIEFQPVLLSSRRHCPLSKEAHRQAGDHTFRFSMTSNPPDSRDGRREAVSAEVPLRVVQVQGNGSGGTLPETRGFLSVDAPNAVVSAFKVAEDGKGVVVRVYDDGGEDVVARLQSAFSLQGATSTDLIEQEDRPADSFRDGVVFFLGHHSIRTFKLQLRN